MQFMFNAERTSLVILIAGSAFSDIGVTLTAPGWSLLASLETKNDTFLSLFQKYLLVREKCRVNLAYIGIILKVTPINFLFI